MEEMRARTYHRMRRLVAATRLPLATAEKSIWYTGKRKALLGDTDMMVSICWIPRQLFPPQRIGRYSTRRVRAERFARSHTDDLFRTRSKAPAPRIGLTLKPCVSYQTTNHSCKKTRSTVIDGMNPISGESYLPQISSVSFRRRNVIQFHSV